MYFELKEVTFMNVYYAHVIVGLFERCLVNTKMCH